MNEGKFTRVKVTRVSANGFQIQGEDGWVNWSSKEHPEIKVGDVVSFSCEQGKSLKGWVSLITQDLEKNAFDSTAPSSNGSGFKPNQREDYWQKKGEFEMGEGFYKWQKARAYEVAASAIKFDVSKPDTFTETAALMHSFAEEVYENIISTEQPKKDSDIEKAQNEGVI